MRLTQSLSTTEPLAEAFSELSLLRAMLHFQVALARAEAEFKIIPQSAARAIARAAHAEDFDRAALAREALRAGTPGIALVKALRKRVAKEDAKAADFVHWGATSQDVVDTALILLLKKTAPILDADLARLQNSLQIMVRKHKDTVMLGRTLLQPASEQPFHSSAELARNSQQDLGPTSTFPCSTSDRWAWLTPPPGGADSYCACSHCGFSGEVKDFTLRNGAPSEGKLVMLIGTKPAQ